MKSTHGSSLVPGGFAGAAFLEGLAENRSPPFRTNAEPPRSGVYEIDTRLWPSMGPSFERAYLMIKPRPCLTQAAWVSEWDDRPELGGVVDARAGCV